MYTLYVVTLKLFVQKKIWKSDLRQNDPRIASQ